MNNFSSIVFLRIVCLYGKEGFDVLVILHFDRFSRVLLLLLDLELSGLSSK